MKNTKTKQGNICKTNGGRNVFILVSHNFDFNNYTATREEERGGKGNVLRGE